MRRWRSAAALMALLAATGIGVARFESSGSAAPEQSPSQRLNPGPEPVDVRPSPPKAEPPRDGIAEDATERPPTRQRIIWRRSVAVGLPYAGRLLRGVKLPASGRHHFTWDPILERSPGRWWRRWGTDPLVRRVLRIARAYRRANPGAPRVTVGDLSRPGGGDFGPRFGLPGHASHQNGLDVDIYYPRLDRAELPVGHPGHIDRPLAQDLVDRFVAAGAQYLFVGPNTGLSGPTGIAQELPLHDDHMHVRFPSG